MRFKTAASQGGAGSAASGAVLTLPTPDMMAGNFSALLGPQVGTDALGRPILSGQIYDPSTTRVVNGQTIRDPFQGNIIPAIRISSISQTVQSYFPSLPNPNTFPNNFVGGSGDTVSEPNYIVKVTQMLGQGSLDVSERVVIHNQDNTYPLPPVLSTWNNFNQHNYSTRIAYNLPLGSRMTANFVLGYDRQAGQGYHSAGLQSTFGITGLFSTNCSTQISIAQMVFTSPATDTLGDGFCDYDNHTQSWKYSGSLAMAFGKHTLKFGGNYFRWTENLLYLEGSNGNFGFDAQVTGLPGANLGQTGFGYASFLLGMPYTANATQNDRGGSEIGNSDSLSKMNTGSPQKLTLNYGVRYDYQPQYTVPGNYQSQFDPTIPNPAAGGLLGGIAFAGYGTGRCNCDVWSPTYPWAFAPRFGFAYKLANNTVVRGSYGLYWQQVSQYAGENQERYGFQPSLSVNDEDAGVTPIFNWQSGFPAFNLTPTIDPTIQNGQSVTYVSHNDAYPGQVQIINFSVQHQLPGNILLEGAYIRNVGHHLSNGNAVELNQLNYATYGHYGNLLNEDVYSTDAVNAGITPPYTGFTGTVAQALRAFPQYLNVSDNNAKIGNSSYNALVVKADKRFTNGLSFLVGYTLSKMLSDVGEQASLFAAGIQDTYNRRAEYAVSPIDQRHAVVASYTYELPFGTGKRLLSGANPVNRYVVGGWKVSGIQNYDTGMPVSISTEQGLPTAAFGIRPNIVPGVNPRGPGSCSGLPGLMLNRAAFADPPPFTFGNAPPEFNNLRGCPTLSENLSLLKSFPVIKERVGVEFGADFFNLLNRHAFSFATDIDSSTFGTVNGTAGGYAGLLGSGRRGQVFMRVTF